MIDLDAIATGILNGTIDETTLQDHLRGDEGFRLAVLRYVLDLADAAAAGGLPDQTGQAGEYLSTDGATASWEPVPSQLVRSYAYAEKTDTASVSGLTPANLLSVTITPTQADSKVLILGSINTGHAPGGGYPWFLNILRGSTILARGDAAGNRTRALSQGYFILSSICMQSPVVIVDSPATNAAVTYNLSFWTGDASATFYLNRSARDLDIANEDPRVASFLLAIELAP